MTGGNFKFMRGNAISKITIVFLILICAWYGRNLDTWGKNKIIQNDVISYYAYLPAAIIFADLTFSFIPELPEDFEGTIWLQTAPNGKPILRMTMGLALLWLPFFLLAHLFAQITGVSALGYSWPYSLSIFLAALFYLALGLYHLRKVLLKYVSDIATALTLATVVLATNLMYYVISEPGMSHVYSFSLIVIFIYFTLKWIETPGVKTTLILGLLAGMIVLIRPVNILVLLFPAFTGINSFRQFIQRISANWKLILLAGVAAFLVLLPQMIYWKAQTGYFIFNSYLDSGKFYFLDPDIMNGLLSYRKGWLIYTPVMIFALGGIFFLRKYAGPLFLPILLFALLNVYVVYSWWCWWYGGSFGSRPMIDMYGIMAIPLAVLITRIWQKSLWIKGAVIIVLAGILLLNQFQMTQYRTSLLHWDSMTREAYWGIFGKTTWPPDYEQMIKVPDYEKALRGEQEYP
jgi:hypothetical protein